MKYHEADPKVRLLTSASVPKRLYAATTRDRKVQMLDQRELGAENMITCVSYSARGQPDWKKQTRVKNSELAPEDKDTIGFDRTQARFNFKEVFAGHSLKPDIPGPGQYETKVRPKSAGTLGRCKTAAVFNTKDKRFKTKGTDSLYQTGCTINAVGPGTYEKEGGGTTMIKKSYNMTIEHCFFV